MGTPTKPRAWADICGLPSVESSSKARHPHFRTSEHQTPPFATDAATDTPGAHYAGASATRDILDTAGGGQGSLSSSAPLPGSGGSRSDSSSAGCSPEPQIASQSAGFLGSTRPPVAGNSMSFSEETTKPDGRSSSCTMPLHGRTLEEAPTPGEAAAHPEAKAENRCRAAPKAAPGPPAICRRVTVNADSRTLHQQSTGERNITFMLTQGLTDGRSAGSPDGSKVSWDAVESQSDRETSFAERHERRGMRVLPAQCPAVDMPLAILATVEHTHKTREPSPPPCSGCRADEEQRGHSVKEGKCSKSRVDKKQEDQQLSAFRAITSKASSLAGFTALRSQNGGCEVASVHSSSSGKAACTQQTCSGRDGDSILLEAPGTGHGVPTYLPLQHSAVCNNLDVNSGHERDYSGGGSWVSRSAAQVSFVDARLAFRDSRSEAEPETGVRGRRREGQGAKETSAEIRRRHGAGQTDSPGDVSGEVQIEPEMLSEDEPREDVRRRRRAPSDLTTGCPPESEADHLDSETSPRAEESPSSREIRRDSAKGVAPPGGQSTRQISTQSDDRRTLFRSQEERGADLETREQRARAPGEGRGRRRHAMGRNPPVEGTDQRTSPTGLEDDEHYASSTSSNETPLDSEIDPFSEEKVILTEAVDWISQLPLWPALNWERVLSHVREREETENMSRDNKREIEERAASPLGSGAQARERREGVTAPAGSDSQGGAVWSGQSPTVREARGERDSRSSPVSRPEHKQSSSRTAAGQSRHRKRKHHGEELVFRFGCVMGTEGVELLRDMLRIKPQDRISAGIAK